jgi:hypothetical protein
VHQNERRRRGTAQFVDAVCDGGAECWRVTARHSRHQQFGGRIGGAVSGDCPITTKAAGENEESDRALQVKSSTSFVIRIHTQHSCTFGQKRLRHTAAAQRCRWLVAEEDTERATRRYLLPMPLAPPMTTHTLSASFIAPTSSDTAADSASSETTLELKSSQQTRSVISDHRHHVPPTGHVTSSGRRLFNVCSPRCDQAFLSPRAPQTNCRSGHTPHALA